MVSFFQLQDGTYLSYNQVVSFYVCDIAPICINVSCLNDEIFTLQSGFENVSEAQTFLDNFWMDEKNENT